LISPGATRHLLGDAAIGFERDTKGNEEKYFLRLIHSQGLEGYKANSLEAGLSFGF
jgi:hypothetical protein